MMSFLYYNNLEEISEQKYKKMEEIQVEYPNIIQIFKNALFPPEIEKGLFFALDDFGDSPIIVRSSSLLEDGMGAAFSGKYKSLFLANQGNKSKRMDELKDAIAEVYSSTFSPDPIEYRTERGLLDFHEEMGIMIQEVVGKKVGIYFFPTFAGVAFNNNEFRWSPRIKREDGLIRIVPGLGTRAVDRMANDYPILIAPNNPGLKVNVTPDEILRYAPQNVDVINLETNSFETVPLKLLLKESGPDIKGIHHLVSIFKDNHLHQPSSFLNIDFNKSNLIVTFEGLINKTSFVSSIKSLLDLLQEKEGTPVDLEFAHDGTDLYLLQCRPQSYSGESKPTPIPRDIDKNRILFSANRYISNGFVPNITHLVYVNPDAYKSISNLEDLKRVGRAIGQLNKILPKRQFVLMGPGRWGSRGDIKLGVEVTYSDINNTIMIIEIAKKKGNYEPELSFGTHFFQDLVEASIRYLPLYPDDEDVIFNEVFFRKNKNIFPILLPAFKDLADIINVIDVNKETEGQVLNILMNADLDEAVAILVDPSNKKTLKPIEMHKQLSVKIEDFWKWRLYMVKQIAKKLDSQRFGVKAFYVFGSTKNATAGPQSDIDVLIHFVGTAMQKKDLLMWLEGWSLTLSEMNYLKTGYKTDGFLDIHLITDEDIANKTRYSVKIDAITDAARPLPMMKRSDRS